MEKTTLHKASSLKTVRTKGISCTTSSANSSSATTTLSSIRIILPGIHNPKTLKSPFAHQTKTK